MNGWCIDNFFFFRFLFHFLWLFVSHEKMETASQAILIAYKRTQCWYRIWEYFDFYNEIEYFLLGSVDNGRCRWKIYRMENRIETHTFFNICVCVWLLYSFVYFIKLYIECVSILFISIFRSAGCNMPRSIHMHEKIEYTRIYAAVCALFNCKEKAIRWIYPVAYHEDIAIWAHSLYLSHERHWMRHSIWHMLVLRVWKAKNEWILYSFSTSK